MNPQSPIPSPARKDASTLLIRKSSKTSGTSPKIAQFAILAFIAFLCGFGLLLLMLARADLLTKFGLIGNLYYVVLLPLGLAVAAFLFGVFRSYAHYRGKQLGGTLELGGPIVGFALVVIGGFTLPKPQPVAFDVTVLVHGEAGLNDLVLRNTGVVWMTLGPDRRQEHIGDKGEADFKAISTNFRGQEVPVSVLAQGFELINPNTKYRLDGNSLYLAVRRKAVRLAGRIQDAAGNAVTNGVVRVGDTRIAVDAEGHFVLRVPGESAVDGVTLEVNAAGYQSWHERFTPSSEAVIVLHRIP